MLDYQRIKYIVLDVDGTLTDGGIYYDSNGSEMKRFDVKDGLGIKVGIESGLEFLILTGRESPMVERRVRELGIQHLLTGVQTKYPVLLSWLNAQGAALEEVCYIGDDINDLQCMKNVGVSMCPSDACEEVKEVSDYVALVRGGHGAVRDCMKTLLANMQKWEEAYEKLYFIK